VKLGSYDLHTYPVQQTQNENYAAEMLPIEVYKNGEDVATLTPEHRVYIASKQPTSEVAIRRRLNEDLYLNFAGMSADNQRAVLQAYVFPLVSWIWIGYWVVLIGTLICLTPAKTRMVWPRTQVVGIAGTHEHVEK
jgi:cytochrome c-type biogenesis protein CcmF